MQNEIISQGVNLMLLGMGVVFVFLTLLVFATTFMSAIITRYFPEPLPSPVKTTPVSPATAQTDPRLLAVIKAAIAEHRSKHRKR
jgi:oxaloacetate decarboxylase gamma subunit